jgi:hypothetical protein
VPPATAMRMVLLLCLLMALFRHLLQATAPTFRQSSK